MKRKLSEKSAVRLAVSTCGYDMEKCKGPRPPWQKKDCTRFSPPPNVDTNFYGPDAPDEVGVKDLFPNANIDDGITNNAPLELIRRKAEMRVIAKASIHLD